MRLRYNLSLTWIDRGDYEGDEENMDHLTEIVGDDLFEILKKTREEIVSVMGRKTTPSSILLEKV